MLRACVAALACLYLGTTFAAELKTFRNLAYNKDIATILEVLNEKFRILETISIVQTKQSRRLDVVQDKLDRLETTISIRLERAQLATDRLEHRLHMLQTSIQTTVKENTYKLAESQEKVVEIAENLTTHLAAHRHLLEKVSGAYAETWKRGLILESLVRDGLSLINVTRREMADGIRALARRQRDTRTISSELESTFTRSFKENSERIDSKLQEVLNTQKNYIDSCQRVQHDDPTHVADVLDRLVDSLINKTSSTFRELQNIQVIMRSHDNRVMKVLSTGRQTQTDATCRRLESAFRNNSQSTLKEAELLHLTEKFVALTDRADAALQQLETRLGIDDSGSQSDVSEAAERLFQKLKGIRSEKEEEHDTETNDDLDDEEEQYTGYYEDELGVEEESDIMEEDEALLRAPRTREPPTLAAAAGTRRLRHLHRHPFDRGPN